MKAKVIALKKNEIKALQGIIENIRAAEAMMKEGGNILHKNNIELWKMLKGMYPKQYEAMLDMSFHYESFELRGFVSESKQEDYNMLKQKAVEERDFEKAAFYRDLEKKELEASKKKAASRK